MIFYFNANGTPITYVPEQIYQGSQKINTIYFLCPIVSTNVVSVNFVLPDGTALEPQIMTAIDYSQNQTLSECGENLSIWCYEVNTSVTKMAGMVKVGFSAVSPLGEVLVTEQVMFEVSKGVPPKQVEEIDAFTQLEQLVSSLSAQFGELSAKYDAKADIAIVDEKFLELNAKIRQGDTKNNKKIEELSQNTYALFNEANLFTVTEATDEYSYRKTANDLSVIENTFTTVKKIVGKTVVDQKNKKLSTQKIKGMFTLGKNLLNVEGRNYLDKVYLTNDYRNDMNVPFISSENRAGVGYPTSIPIPDLTYSDGVFTWTNNVSDYGLSFNMRVKPNTTYYFSFTDLNQNIDEISVTMFDKDGKYKEYRYNFKEYKFTTPSYVHYVVLSFRPFVMSAVSVAVKDFMVSLEPCEYQPYKENVCEFANAIDIGLGVELDFENKIIKNQFQTDVVSEVELDKIFKSGASWQHDGYFGCYIVNALSKKAIGKEGATKLGDYEKYYVAVNDDAEFIGTEFNWQRQKDQVYTTVEGPAVIAGNNGDRVLYLRFTNQMLGINQEDLDEVKRQAVKDYLASKPLTVRYRTVEVEYLPLEESLNYEIASGGIEGVIFEDVDTFSNLIDIEITQEYFTRTGGND